MTEPKQNYPPKETSFSVTLKAGHLAFDSAILFEELDLTLVAGGWTCLLGPSGVGKTTLLRLIAGLVPDARDVAVTCSDNLPLAHRAAYMAQQDLLLPWLSVAENVALGSRLRGLNGHDDFAEERARQLLNRVGLAANADDLPNKLSVGMRMRVALARTLMEDRPVVLMDEPFSALDAITRVRLQDMASELLAGSTVLLVTHDPLEALRLSDKIFVLSGRPVSLAAPLELTGDAPRDLHDPQVLEGQADLLDRLARADERQA